MREWFGDAEAEVHDIGPGVGDRGKLPIQTTGIRYVGHAEAPRRRSLGDAMSPIRRPSGTGHEPRPRSAVP